MGLSHSPGFGFIEGRILVRPSLFERGYHVNAIHLQLGSLFEGSERSFSQRTPRNRLYLPDDILRGLTGTIVTPGSKFALTLVAPFEATVLSLLYIFL